MLKPKKSLVGVDLKVRSITTTSSTTVTTTTTTTTTVKTTTTTTTTTTATGILSSTLKQKGAKRLFLFTL